ncbi:6-pyruvoyl tetrahydropterin synthase family protein [Embleya sp. NPDC059237]|uniref:6-pyruvoyl trahydropterin synthase family protein n=1 Tax=Embleya sp. NPDC059237 TaxID=3346784 RepID=UPI00369D1CA2
MTRLTIGKAFRFEAAHHLPGLPAGHQCARLHGHSYTATLTLSSPRVNEVGFVADFADLSPFGTYLADTFDHRVLNDVMMEPPTCENIATHLLNWALENLPPDVAALTAAVRVQETATCWAECTVDWA